MARVKLDREEVPDFDGAQDVDYADAGQPDFDEAAQADYSNDFADGEGDDGGSQEWRLEPQMRAAPPRGR